MQVGLSRRALQRQRRRGGGEPWTDEERGVVVDVDAVAEVDRLLLHADVGHQQADGLSAGEGSTEAGRRGQLVLHADVGGDDGPVRVQPRPVVRVEYIVPVVSRGGDAAVDAGVSDAGLVDEDGGVLETIAVGAEEADQQHPLGHRLVLRHHVLDAIHALTRHTSEQRRCTAADGGAEVARVGEHALRSHLPCATAEGAVATAAAEGVAEGGLCAAGVLRQHSG